MDTALEKGQAICESEIVSAYLDGLEMGRVIRSVTNRSQGKSKDWAEGMVEVALHMINLRMSTEDITYCTGLTLEELQSLMDVSYDLFKMSLNYCPGSKMLHTE